MTGEDARRSIGRCCRAALDRAGGTSIDFAQDRLCPYVSGVSIIKPHVIFNR
jgi:hypothetical protein